MAPLKTYRLAALDDSAADLSLLEEHLADLPDRRVELHGVQTSQELVSILQRKQIDLAFIDHDLGHETGVDVIARLRAAGQTMPLVALTGQQDHRVAARLVVAGADDYLSKSDLSAETLRRVLEGVLERRRLQAEKAALEEQLQQARKLEALGILAGGIAHDFNNLLASIQGNIELSGYHKLPEPVVGLLGRALKSCGNMANLVKLLLACGNGSPVTPIPLDVGGLVRDSSEILQLTVPAGVDVVVDVPDDPLVVAADPAMIQIAIMNLARNGLEAMPAGGHLTMRANRRHVDEGALVPAGSGGVDTIVIEVADEGEGVAPGIRDRIFEPYFTTKQHCDQRGSGLGLALVWQTVKRHGGAIRFESDVGHGSTFSIVLPEYRMLSAPPPMPRL